MCNTLRSGSRSRHHERLQTSGLWSARHWRCGHRGARPFASCALHSVPPGRSSSSDAQRSPPSARRAVPHRAQSTAVCFLHPTLFSSLDFPFVSSLSLSRSHPLYSAPPRAPPPSCMLFRLCTPFAKRARSRTAWLASNSSEPGVDLRRQSHCGRDPHYGFSLRVLCASPFRSLAVVTSRSHAHTRGQSSFTHFACRPEGIA